MDSFLFRSLRTFSNAFWRIAFYYSSFESFSVSMIFNLKSFLNLEMIKFIYCSVRKFGNSDIFGIIFYSYFYLELLRSIYLCLLRFYLSRVIGVSPWVLSLRFYLFYSSKAGFLLIYFSIHVNPYCLTSKPNSREKYNTIIRAFSNFFKSILIGSNS